MVAELVKNDEPEILTYVVPAITEGEKIQLALRSEWQNDNPAMLSFLPNPVPEGWSFTGEWKTVTNKVGTPISIILLTAHPPKTIVLKPGVVDRNAMTDDQLRTWCHENDVSLKGDEPKDPRKAWSRTRILDAIQRAGK